MIKLIDFVVYEKCDAYDFRRQYIKKTKTAVRNLPLCPEINLFLLEEDYPKEPVSRYEFTVNIASPPYWAFCRASGQASARFILDNRALVHKNKDSTRTSPASYLQN